MTVEEKMRLVLRLAEDGMNQGEIPMVEQSGQKKRGMITIQYQFLSSPKYIVKS